MPPIDVKRKYGKAGDVGATGRASVKGARLSCDAILGALRRARTAGELVAAYERALAFSGEATRYGYAKLRGRKSGPLREKDRDFTRVPESLIDAFLAFDELYD